ncbi:hypothetical protein ANCCAN_12276 [Ancylostoma caninum]|uniref:Low-density lipoprotein receptor domain class A n=1 Tax=Ancylostoma caninum TaxID=29170 RepID=A0A368GFG9_ANCCA|nr:hypothetical protein ANCCAN_12276 [Ancylostoma caninum]
MLYRFFGYYFPPFLANACRVGVEYTCHSGDCVHIEKKCDGKKDCPDAIATALHSNVAMDVVSVRNGFAMGQTTVQMRSQVE